MMPFFELAGKLTRWIHGGIYGPPESMFRSPQPFDQIGHGDFTDYHEVHVTLGVLSFLGHRTVNKRTPDFGPDRSQSLFEH